MAEIAASAFAATAATAAAAVPAMSTAATVLAGLATAGSVLMGLQAAQASKVQGEAALADAKISAEVAGLEGERAATASAARAVELRRDALRKIGAARTAFAGSGLDVSSGQLEAFEGDVNNEVEYGLAFEQTNQKLGRVEAKLHGERYKARGENAYYASLAKADAQQMEAYATGARGLLSIARRG